MRSARRRAWIRRAGIFRRAGSRVLPPLWRRLMSGTNEDGAAKPDFGPVTMQWDRSIPGVLRVVVTGTGGDPDAALRRWLYNFNLARESNLHRIMVVLK